MAVLLFTSPIKTLVNLMYESYTILFYHLKLIVNLYGKRHIPF